MLACVATGLICIHVHALTMDDPLGDVKVEWPSIELPEQDPIAGITNYPEAYLDWWDQERRTAGNTSVYTVFPGVVDRGTHYHELLESDGPAALAKAMVEAYPTKDAWRELAGGAIAVCAGTGYMEYGRGIKEKWLGIPKEKQGKGRDKKNVLPEELVQAVNPVIDEILKIDSPHAKDTAAEFLLQLFSETFGSGHCESHNGRREIESYPRELTARAAEFLGSEDPFTHAVAEWAVSTSVCNENESSGGEAWPGKTPPDWWDTWYKANPAKDRELEYVRQAVQLQMHRHGRDLLTLSEDQMRRAIAKAEWAKAQLPADQAGTIDAEVAEMKSAHAKFASVVKASPDDLTACRKAFLQWRPTVRDVVMRGPDIDFDSVVYVTRNSGGPHGQPGSQGTWEGREGDIFVQKGLSPGSPNQALIGEKLPPRLIGDLDIWYDADKVVFCAADKDTWHIYEIDLEGKSLTTLPQTGDDDHNCAYLPDGGVVFASTAHRQAVMCVGNANGAQSNIFRLDPAHKTIERLTFSKDDDDYPYVLNDGRIVWMRWDYQERNVDEIFALWVIRPDGTGSDGYYCTHLPETVIVQTLRDPVPIPGTQKIIAAGGSHRTGPEGNLILADPSMGINNPLSIRTVTPYSSPTTKGVGQLMRPVQEGGVPYPGGMICTPTALSEKSFLTPMSHDMPESNFWLYYVDVWGNKELIHRDKRLETVCAFPVRKRFKPPVLPDLSDPSKTYATCYVDNVYADLPGVEKGEVKYIRILKNIGWPKGYQFHPLANGSETFGYPGTGGPIQVIGIVPVEEDGSANFQAPAKMDLYFQALDKDYRAVQRMRTHVEFGWGEKRSCVGCHETRGNVPLTRAKGKALDYEAVRPTPPSWGDTTLIDYETMIQPIFEKKCVKCHGEKDPKAGLNLTAKKDEQGFMQSYRSMWGIQPGEKSPKVGKTRLSNWRKGTYFTDHPWARFMVDFVNVRSSADRQGEDAIPNIPNRYGAIAHPLAAKLVGEGKHGTLLTDEEKQLLMTWFDIQAPYYAVCYAWKGEGKTKTVLPYPPFEKSREYVYPNK
jgi:hypothetical protein